MSRQIYGLIGWPVKHSLSAAMHNAAFNYCKIPAEYKLFSLPPEQLKDFLLGKIHPEVLGFNITIPHKVEAWKILQFSKRGSTTVQLVGAINTVKRDKKDVRNTDADGFRKALIGRFDPENKKACLIGCGGAGRGVIAGLNNIPRPKIVYVYENNKNIKETAQAHFQNYKDILEYEYEFISQDQLPEVVKDCQLLINATPLGMREEDASPIDKNLLHKDLYVYDLVYNRETELIKDAKSFCSGAAGGSDMLLYQGVEAWEFWIGQDAPVEVMRQALNKELEDK